MPIRRKSTQQRQPKECSYHDQMQHERDNHYIHDTRRRQFPESHDPTPCWCCCEDCTDLTWYYTPRKGVWWAHSESGDLKMVRDSSASLDPTRSSSSIPMSSDGSGDT